MENVGIVLAAPVAGTRVFQQHNPSHQNRPRFRLLTKAIQIKETSAETAEVGQFESMVKGSQFMQLIYNSTQELSMPCALNVIGDISYIYIYK